MEASELGTELQDEAGKGSELMEFRQLSPDEAASWDEVVASSREGAIFHTDTWLRLIEDSLGLGVTKLAALDDGKMVGVLPLSFNVGLRYWVLARKLPPCVTSPPIRVETHYGGPVALPGRSDVVVGLVKHVLRRKRASFEIVFAPDHWNTNRQYPDLGYLGEAVSAKSTYIVDLKPSEDELWSRLKSNMKTHVRKARKLGVKFLESRESSDLVEFYRILQRTCSRSGFSCLPLRFYSGVLRAMGENAHLFFTEVDGQKATSEISLVYQNRLYAWSGGSDERFWASSPNNLMSWEIIRWAKGRGLLSYDQCGAGPPSVAKFKEGLGGAVHSYPYLFATWRVHAYASSFIRTAKSIVRRSSRSFPRQVRGASLGRNCDHREST